jgi:diguanylate cyclase (GGDEF)-like protein
VDIDRFKMVNDTLGHEAGDRLIEYVSLFLKRNVRETDYVFRWGGDEFLLLLSCEFDEAQTKAAALTSSFRVALETSEMPSSVGLSVGCSEVLAHTDDIMQLIREADQAMYRNKNKSPSPITSRVKQIGENQPPPIRLVSSPLGHNLPARTRASVSRDTNNASRVNRSPYMTISKEVRDR